MKRLYFYLIILIIGIFLWINFFSLKNEMRERFVPATYNNLFSAPQENLGLIKENITVSDEIDLDYPFPLNKMYKAEEGQNYLYTLSYRPSGNAIHKGSSLNQTTYASDQITLIFRESYPNVTLEEMGVNSIEEAYLVTQLAIWEVAWRTDESKFGSEYSYIESIKNDIGINSKTEKIFKKAEDLVRLVESFSYNDDFTENYNMTTTLIVNNEDITLKSVNDCAWLGPYYYRVENGIADDAEIELEDEEGEASTYVYLVDESGKKIKNVKDVYNKPIYVCVPQEHLKDKFVLKLNFKASISKLAGTVYEDNYYDYIMLGTLRFDGDDEVEQTLYLRYDLGL